MLKTTLAVALAGLTLIIGALLSLSGATQAAPRWTVTPQPTFVAQATVEPTVEAVDAALIGDPARGQEIFRQGVNGSPPCSSCHATTSSRSVFQLGPNLVNVGERAAERVEGLSAEAYIRESILEPTAYLVGGYRPIMYPGFADHFNEQDIADLIAYLLTL
jgi:cytochrome c oxidase subunit 2